jgi:nucleotide-binding universal stress UspA family protein
MARAVQSYSLLKWVTQLERNQHDRDNSPESLPSSVISPKKAELELASVIPKEDLEFIDRRIVCSIKVGHPVTTIIDYASQLQVDLVFVGTHGRFGFSHLLLGSVAEKLFQLSQCPVLTVHPTE